jgi:hypothetical protein
MVMAIDRRYQGRPAALRPSSDTQGNYAKQSFAVLGNRLACEVRNTEVA